MAKKRGKIVYKKNWFNPLFWVVDELIRRGVIEFYIYGGKSSSKTITIAQTIAKRCLATNQKAICFRKETSTIKTTLKPSYEKAIESVRLDRKYKFLEFLIRSRLNRASITFKGIDRAQKVKGIEGYADTHHDEIDQFTYEDYTESVNAHRGEVAKVKFFSWNPVDINSWIKTRVVDTEAWADADLKLPSEHSFVKISSCGKKALIKTVYQDNYWTAGSPCGTYGFRDDALIARYEKMREVDPLWYDINVLGNWGVIKPEHPFFVNFRRDKHTAKGLELNKHLPIALVFDFNIAHSCIAGQFSLMEKYSRILKEFRLSGVDFIDLITRIVDHFGRNRRYIITGDASGNNSNALTKGNASAYGIMFSTLKRLGVEFESLVPASNQSHINSKAISNAILFYEDDFLIDEDECPELIADIERMRTGKDGGLDKKHADANNYGHLGDCFRYWNDNFLIDWYWDYDIIHYDE